MFDNKIELLIIELNIIFFNAIILLIDRYLISIECNNTKKNIIRQNKILLLNKKKLELELKDKLDKINKNNTIPQTIGNLIVSDKLKILMKENNICNILLFLSGRTSYIRGYCAALLITKLDPKYYIQLAKTIDDATKLENELFIFQQYLQKNGQCCYYTFAHLKRRFKCIINNSLVL